MRSLILSLLGLTIPLGAFCQNSPDGKPVFSSQFTDVRDSIVVGRYRVHLENGNDGRQLHVVAPYKTLFDLGLTDGASGAPGLEWRMADGRPMALIAPVTIWRSQRRDDRNSPRFVRTGKLLAVCGLGYGVIGMPCSHIDTVIDATLPDAGALARQLADNSCVVPARRGKK